MKNLLLTRWIIVAGAAAMCSGVTQARAQSVDALLDKLVDKGILTTQEATELKAESNKGFSTAYSAKSGLPGWVSSMKFNGDLRGRYEGFFSDATVVSGGSTNSVDRNRFRYRLRFGATATFRDDFEVGLRLTSGEPANGGNGGDPISGNTTFQDNASKKFIYLDLAYGKWKPLNTDRWTGALTVGKMENPFVFSDMVFDGDYTPEGVAVQLGYNLNEKHALKFNAGAFVIDEIGSSSSDPFFVGAQLRMDSAWSRKVRTSVGIAGLAVDNEEFLNALRVSTLTPSGTNTTTTWTVPNQNAGNLRSPVSGTSGRVGDLENSFNPIVADASVTYSLDEFWFYDGAFPIRLAADFIHNPAAGSQNSGYSAGITFGKSGKRGLWDLSYRYKYLEGDAWYEEFVDSDFGAVYQSGSLRSGNASGYLSGTNVRGHLVRASYTPVDSLTLGVTAFLTELIQENPDGSASDMTRLQVDAVLKF